MTRRVTTFAMGLSLLGLSVLGGCPLLEVEVEVPEVCLGYEDLRVDGLDAAGPTTQARSFVIEDLSAVHALTELDADVVFLRASIRARAGIDDFGFVEAARIAIASGAADTAMPPLELYACDGDCVAAGGALDMTAAARRDALAYLREESLIVDVALTGELPRAAWSMDVEVCFSARARYTY